ncbi:MFS transporter [Bacteroidia bacterium]|nr:MFS transporter [Bacteroidia bacterium]
MKPLKIHPWTWLPTLYFTEGLPYVILMTVAMVMYKNMGISNTDIALFTSLLNFPWLIKPLWSPFVDILKTKRWWILIMQFFIGAGLAGVAFAIPAPFFFQATMAVFTLLAFSSATHDIAIDGFYMLELSPFQQSYFVGIRTTFYRIAMITGQGLMVMLAGRLEKVTGSVTFAWTLAFGAAASIFLLLSLYHSLVLPKQDAVRTVPQKSFTDVLGEFGATFVTFFQKKGIVAAIVFLLLYRLAEAQLTKIAVPFMLDTADKGGLGLETEITGFVYGTVGVVALVLGGISGGVAISLKGLKQWLVPMMLALNLPDIVYVLLAYFQPDNLWLVNAAVAVEQFGYGFGFTAYTLFMIYIAQGCYKTAHYAICTAFMTAGMMLPGMAAGWLQEMIGYRLFFIWVMICTIPAFFVLPYLKIDGSFGMKKNGRTEERVNE